jgi:hypothetical protein
VTTTATATAPAVRLVLVLDEPALRHAVEELARCFRAELGFARLPYRADDPGEPLVRAYAWLAAGTLPPFEAAAGAIVFRRHGLPGRWSLSWVWLHPAVRHRGILSAAWPAFRAELGDFAVAPPLSPAMARFLAARGECARCGRRCRCLPDRPPEARP